MRQGMTRWSLSRALLTLVVSGLAWGLVAAGCLAVGSTGTLALPTPEQLAFRREPVLLASLVGAALAAAGVVYQAILRNPLADPYLLGVSSGASLFAYLWQFSSATALATVLSSSGQAFSQQAFAFVGGAVAVAIVFVLASSRGRLEPITLLLVGVIVNAVNASIFLLLNAITKDRPGAGGPLTFLVGGINATVLTSQQFATAAVLIALGFLLLLYLSGQLNVAVLSEAEAQALGVGIQRLRWVGLITASFITASAVAISGPIGFIGLVCPHLARLFVGSDTRRLLPVATATGASLLALADAASRFLAGEGRAQTLLPVGVLTGLLGGPFFLLLLWQNRRRVLPEAQP